MESSSHGNKKRKADESGLGSRSGQDTSTKPTSATASPAAKDPPNQGPAKATETSLLTVLPVDNQVDVVAEDTQQQQEEPPPPAPQQEPCLESSSDLQETLAKDPMAKIEESIAQIEADIKEIKAKERLAETFIIALDKPATLAKLFSDPSKEFIKTIISVDQSTEEQGQALRNYITDCRAERRVLNQLLVERVERKLVLMKGNRDIQILPSNRSLPEEESGIVYIEDEFRIKMEGGNSPKSIGLLTKEGHGPVKLRRDMQELDLSAQLDAAWSLTTMDVTNQQFCTKLWEVVPSLSKNFVENAWRTLMDKYELDVEDRPNEMFFHQAICTPFAKLLMAAASGNPFADGYYKAKEVVYSSMAVIRKRNEDESTTQKCKLSFRPGSAATLHQQWDAFGMMGIDARGHDLIDHDKRVLMTAATAIAVRKCIQKEDYEKVLLPFIISTRDCATLYVTGLNEAGTPVVYFVRYPDGSNSRWADLSKSPCESNTKLFVAFAVLLNNFKHFFETTVKQEYMKQVKTRIPLVQQLETYAPSRCTSGLGNPHRLHGSDEQSAKEAGEYGGMFFDLVGRFEGWACFTDNGLVDKVQTESPFYFTGQEASSEGSREVLLKVWRIDETDIASVKAEWKYHNKAFKAGVPVPEPVLSKLAVSTCSRGFAHLVFAMEIIYKEYINTMDQLWNFCFSLIQAVLMLHEKAQVLHCDIKPDNIRWNGEGVRLIDFWNAQDITNAWCVEGTQCFQAPEILNGVPCSTKTDAFSVGRTISMKLCTFSEAKLPSQEEEKYLILQDISVKLTDKNPDSRWSLSQALSAMQNYMATDSQM